MISRRIKKIGLVLVVSVLGLILFVIPIFFAYSFSVTGLPRGTDTETPEDYGMDYQNFLVSTSDDVEIKGWFISGTNNATIIIHGGGGGVTKGTSGVIPGGELSFSLLPIAKFLQENGYNTVLFDRRLNGESGNGPFADSSKDVFAIVDYIKTKTSLDPNRIGLWGNSAGGWIAIKASGENNHLFKAVVADAPVPSFAEAGGFFQLTFGIPSFPIYDMVMMYSPLFNGGKSVDASSSYNYVDKISPIPFFLIIEENDRMLPPSSIKQLYDLAGEPKYIWEGIEAAHVEAYFKNPDEYQRRILAFYDTYLLDLPRENEI